MSALSTSYQQRYQQRAAQWLGGYHCYLTAKRFQVQSPAGAILCGVFMFSLYIFSGYSCFLPQSKDMYVRLMCVSKLPVRVIVCLHGCWSTCGPVMDWWWTGVQGEPQPLPKEGWDRLQQILMTLNRTTQDIGYQQISNIMHPQLISLKSALQSSKINKCMNNHIQSRI